jgi:hypothetical protein
MRRTPPSPFLAFDPQTETDPESLFVLERTRFTSR